MLDACRTQLGSVFVKQCDGVGAAHVTNIARDRLGGYFVDDVYKNDETCRAPLALACVPSGLRRLGLSNVVGACDCSALNRHHTGQGERDVVRW